MMLRVRHLRKTSQATVPMSMRAFSAAPEAETPRPKRRQNNEFAKDRARFKNELSALRKQWAADHQAKLDKRAEEERMERRKIVLQRAIRLRERRQETARNLETQRIFREEQLRRYKENLARTHILWEERAAKLKRQRQAALKDFAAESNQWITPANKDQLITPKLFELHPTTTGIVTHTSEYWRHEVFVPSMQRLLSPQFMEKIQTLPRDEADMQREGHINVAKRAVVETFLNGIITSAEDRKNFRSLVKRTTLEFEAGGAFDDLEEAMNEGLVIDDGAHDDDDYDDLDGELVDNVVAHGKGDVDNEVIDSVGDVDFDDMTDEEFEQTVLKMMKSREFLEELEKATALDEKGPGEDEKFKKLLSETDEDEDDEDEDDEDDEDDDDDEDEEEDDEDEDKKSTEASKTKQRK